MSTLDLIPECELPDLPQGEYVIQQQYPDNVWVDEHKCIRMGRRWMPLAEWLGKWKGAYGTLPRMTRAVGRCEDDC